MGISTSTFRVHSDRVWRMSCFSVSSMLLFSGGLLDMLGFLGGKVVGCWWGDKYIARGWVS